MTGVSMNTAPACELFQYIHCNKCVDPSNKLYQASGAIALVSK